MHCTPRSGQGSHGEERRAYRERESERARERESESESESEREREEPYVASPSPASQPRLGEQLLALAVEEGLVLRQASLELLHLQYTGRRWNT